MLGFVLVAAVIVLLAYLAGSSDELSESGGRLAGAIAGDLVDIEAGQPPPAFSSTEAVCIAEAIVRDIGLGRLNALGVERASVDAVGFTPSAVRFDADERIAIVDAFDGCVDLLEAAVASIAPDGGQATRTCVRSALGEEGDRQLWEWRVGPATGNLSDELSARIATADSCLLG